MGAGEAVVAYRLERAREALEDARIFYSVSGLLLQQGLSSSKHTGVRGLFNLNFVRTGRFPKSLARTYNDLFAHRQDPIRRDKRLQVSVSEQERSHLHAAARRAGLPLTEQRAPASGFEGRRPDIRAARRIWRRPAESQIAPPSLAASHRK
jgi:uncharacterized protein (UPF0332 family)